MPRYQLSVYAEKLPRGRFRRPNPYAEVPSAEVRVTASRSAKRKPSSIPPNPTLPRFSFSKRTHPSIYHSKFLFTTTAMEPCSPKASSKRPKYFWRRGISRSKSQTTAPSKCGMYCMYAQSCVPLMQASAPKRGRRQRNQCTWLTNALLCRNMFITRQYVREH